MSTTSDVSICNIALMRLGSNPISSLTEGTTAANACNLVYDHLRRSLLSEHFWNFSMKREELSIDMSAPLFGNHNKFPLPNDFLRMREVYNQSSPYSIEEGYIYTNDPAPLMIRYVKDMDNVSEFSPLFINCLVLQIIIHIGARIQGEGFSPVPYVEQFDRELMKAKKVDAQDNTPEQFKVTPFTHSRHRLDPLPRTY